MRAGDVLRVRPSRGECTYALWLKDGQPVTCPWQDYENLQAVAQAEAIMAEAEAAPEALELTFGQMPAFTYVGGGELRSAIEVSKGTTGPVVYLGEAGRGRRRAEVPILGFEAEKVQSASIAILSETTTPARYSWDKPTVKRIFGLTQSAQVEVGAVLLRVEPSSGGRTFGRTKPLRGEPTLIASGVEASGAAGHAGSWDDTLWVLKPGDAVVIEGSENLRVFENTAGKLATTPWKEWEIADGKANPKGYLERGKAPWGMVPAEWIGRIVQTLGGSSAEGGDDYEGELISVSPLVLNLGWDGRDRRDVTVRSGAWVKLNAHSQVRRLEGSEAAQRAEAQAEVARLRAEAGALRKQGYFSCVDQALRERVGKVAEGRESSDYGDEVIDFAVATTSDVESWAEWAKGIMSEAGSASGAAQELNSQRERGEVLVEFGGHFRVMGATGNAQYWVIRPDGTEREPDEVQYRKRYTSEGEKIWRRVESGELAISWSKAFTAAAHEFVVNKLPEGGCTAEQLAVIERLELEISDRFHGATGCSGRLSPEIGDGWGLRPAVESLEAEATEDGPSEPAKVDITTLAGLFGGAARVIKPKK